MKKWLIFTAVYVLIVIWFATGANENIFGPDKEGTIYIGAIVYVILVILYFVFKGLKKLFN
jgi:hypothetical protein